MIRAPAEAVPREYLEKTFIDRKKERSELRALLVLERRKLVVLSGERGCGKTALVRMFCTRHEGDFPGGIFFASGPILEMKALQESFHGVHAGPVSAFSSIGVIERPGDYSLRIIDSIAPLRRQTLESVLAPFLKRPKEQVLLIDVPPTFTRLGDTALPADYALVNLGNLTEHETAAAIRMLLADMGTAFRISEKTTSFLYHLTGGNLFVLQTALAYLQDHGFNQGKLRNALAPFQRLGIVGPDGRPLTPESHAYKRIVTDVSQVSDELLAKLASDPKELYKLSSRLFEEVVAELLRRLHYNVTLTPASGDGGKDIMVASRADLGSFLYYVECKRYAPDHPVGVNLIRELYGVVQADRVTAGILATTSFFTKGAKEFQSEVAYQISLRDYFGIQDWLQKAGAGHAATLP